MDKKNFAPTCLSIDLEVGRDDSRIYEFSAVRGDDGRALTPGKNKVREGLAEVSDFSQGLKFLLGHNIRKFDLPHLRAAKPELELLSWPVIDTLWLNPLAFPRNPYHRLVKHYQDGQLAGLTVEKDPNGTTLKELLYEGASLLKPPIGH